MHLYFRSNVVKKKIITILMAILSFCTCGVIATGCSNDSDIRYAANVMDEAIDKIDYLNTLMFDYADNDEPSTLLLDNKSDGPTISAYNSASCFSATNLYGETNRNYIPSDVGLYDEPPKEAIAKQLNAKYPFEVTNYLLQNAVGNKYYKKKYKINKTFYGQATHIINDDLNEYFRSLNIKPTLAVNIQKENDGISFKADWDWRHPTLKRDNPGYNTVICTNGRVVYDDKNGKVEKIYMSWFWEEAQSDFMACLLDLESNEFYYLGGYRDGEYLPQKESIVGHFNGGATKFLSTVFKHNYKGLSVVKANVVDNLEDFKYTGYKYWDNDTSSTTNVLGDRNVTEEEFVALLSEVYDNVSPIKLRGKEGYLSLSNATEIDYMNNAAIYAYNRTVIAITDDGINYLFTDKKDMRKILDGLIASDVVNANADAVELINKAKVEFEKQDNRYIGDLGYYFGSGIEYNIRYGNGYSYDEWCHYCKDYKRIIKNNKITISFDYSKNQVSNVVINEDFSYDGDDIPEDDIPEEDIPIEREPLVLTYEYDESLGGYKVVGYTGDVDPNQVIEIPETYQNMPVKGIGERAFAGCATASIVIPNSVTTIGSQAFYRCDYLTIYCESTSKPSAWGDGWNYLEYAGAPAPVVWDCANNNIADDGNIYVVVNDLRYALKDGKATIVLQSKNVKKANILEEIVLEENRFIVTSIDDYAFIYCSSLTSIVLPNGLAQIGERAFMSCNALTSIELGDGVTSIGKYAFAYCNSLEEIEISDSVISIGEGAFSNCRNLTNIKTGNGITSLDSFDASICETIHLGSNITDIGNVRFSKCVSITVDSNNATYKDIDGNLYSKNGKTLIQYAGGKTATAFTIPNSVTSIGSNAFGGCKALTSIVIPDSVTSIGEAAFERCSSLQYNIESNLKYLGNSNNKFRYLVGTTSTSITTVSINSNCKFIGGSAFAYCNSLEEIVIPNGVVSVGSKAFYYCKSLAEVEIPDSVTSIGEFAFNGCRSLQYNTEGNLKYLGNSNNRYIYLAGTTSMSKATVSINSNCKFIGDNAFEYCSLLTSVTIPDSVTSIGKYAFNVCNKLIEVINKSSRITVTKGSSDNGYVGYYALHVSNRDDSYVSRVSTDSNGYVTYVDGADKILVNYVGNETELTLPSGVTKINKELFAHCSSLKSVTIPDSVTSIGEYVFNGCVALTSVYYQGTAIDWEKISNGADDSFLANATLYYYSQTQPTIAGNYWHYDENEEIEIWKEVFNINYDANGGDFAPASQTKNIGVDLTLSSEYPVREGYVFAGWKNSLEDRVYMPSEVFSLNQDVTFYATWNKICDKCEGAGFYTEETSCGCLIGSVCKNCNGFLYQHTTGYGSEWLCRSCGTTTYETCPYCNGSNQVVVNHDCLSCNKTGIIQEL